MPPEVHKSPCVWIQAIIYVIGVSIMLVSISISNMNTRLTKLTEREELDRQIILELQGEVKFNLLRIERLEKDLLSLSSGPHTKSN